MSGYPESARREISEQAASWFVRMRDPVQARELNEAFSKWLLDSPVHVHEYLLVARVWGDLEHVDDVGDSGSVDCLSDMENVVSLGEGFPYDDRQQPPKPRRRDRNRRRMAALAASAVAATALALFLVMVPGTDPERYATSRGEQRSVILADGSVVLLNTLTEIVVEIGAHQRRVRLVTGEALFDVARDRNRPFIVDSGAALVQVLGTKFNVYKSSAGTSVTVIDGTVSILPPASAGGLPEEQQMADSHQARTTTLVAGQQAIVGEERVETLTLPALEPVLAWTERRLIFESASLAKIVEEFNRYNRVQFELDDAAVAELELSGAFNSNDPDSLIAFLRRTGQVQVISLPGGDKRLTRIDPDP